MSRLVLSPHSNLSPRWFTAIETRYAPVFENLERTSHRFVNYAVTWVDSEIIFSSGNALDVVAEIKHPPLRVSGHRRDRHGFRANVEEKGHFGTPGPREISTQDETESTEGTGRDRRLPIDRKSVV